MATELIMKFPGQVDPITLHRGGGGAFEVSVDGKQIWSKLQTKQYPELSAVTKAVTEALGTGS
jgi:selT/selW/selH-like putative selenoprotein